MPANIRASKRRDGKMVTVNVGGEINMPLTLMHGRRKAY